MASKTYELLPWMDADAPVFQQIGDNQRVKVKKIPFHRPTLRQTFQDEKGVNRTIRYKEMSKSIYQDVQIKDELIPANDPFTQQEYAAMMFRFGILTTDNENIQTYLEAHPEYEGFKGKCADIRKPKYKLVDEVKDNEDEVADFEKRLKVGNRISAITDLQVAKDLLIKLNGSFFETPDELKKCKVMLIAFMDDTNDAGLDAMLEDEVGVDDKVAILVGNALNKGILSFDAELNQVSKKVGDKWVPVKLISNEHNPDERMTLFCEFLATEEGKPLVNDLEKALKKNDKK